LLLSSVVVLGVDLVALEEGRGGGGGDCCCSCASIGDGCGWGCFALDCIDEASDKRSSSSLEDVLVRLRRGRTALDFKDEADGDGGGISIKGGGNAFPSSSAEEVGLRRDGRAGVFDFIEEADGDWGGILSMDGGGGGFRRLGDACLLVVAVVVVCSVSFFSSCTKLWAPSLFPCLQSPPILEWSNSSWSSVTRLASTNSSLSSSSSSCSSWCWCCDCIE